MERNNTREIEIVKRKHIKSLIHREILKFSL